MRYIPKWGLNVSEACQGVFVRSINTVNQGGFIKPTHPPGPTFKARLQLRNEEGCQLYTTRHVFRKAIVPARYFPTPPSLFSVHCYILLFLRSNGALKVGPVQGRGVAVTLHDYGSRRPFHVSIRFRRTRPDPSLSNGETYTAAVGGLLPLVP